MLCMEKRNKSSVQLIVPTILVIVGYIILDCLKLPLTIVKYVQFAIDRILVSIDTGFQKSLVCKAFAVK